MEELNIKLYIKELFDDEKEVEEALKNSFKSLVGLDFQKYLKEVNVKSIRKNVTIPSWLNEVAKRNNINFSKVIQEELERELEMHKINVFIIHSNYSSCNFFLKKCGII